MKGIKHNSHHKRSPGRIAVYGFAVFWLLTTIVPLLLAVFSSFKNNIEIYSNPFGIPEIWRFQNYHSAIYDIDGLHAIWNSLIVSFATAFGVLVIGLLASYPMSRKRMKWVQYSYFLFVLAVMVPVHVALIPISSLASKIGAKNHMWYLVLVYIAFNMAQAIFLISGYMNGISRELDEAAILDGCGDMGLLFRILAPICKPILATEAIFAFVYAYGELIFSLTLISDIKQYTVSRALLSFYGEGDFLLGPIFAFIVLSTIPSVLVYICFHRQIQGGVMSGAIKG